jgi:cysteine desulfurase
VSVYLDCNATTPIEPEVLEVVLRILKDEYGNAGSRTHEFGVRAKQAVERARDAVAAVVGADPQEVIFTSGATESNNIAILGLAEEGRRSGRMHMVSTAMEHKAVLEPLEHLAKLGFELTLVPPTAGGYVEAGAIVAALRPDTLLVSVMHVNNETGVIQPISDIAQSLNESECYFHVDAAQGFGKEVDALRHTRIDLISLSGHKIYAPKGIGALIARRRGKKRPQLSPLTFGGGQERGLRPGTLPVHLIAGLGEASRIAQRDLKIRRSICERIRADLMNALQSLPHSVNGDQRNSLVTTVNLSIPGVDSEAAMVALKGVAAVSNGSACTSASYTASHVLLAMQLPPERVSSALRLSWCHLTPDPPWREIATRLRRLI